MKVADNGVGAFPDCRRKSNSFGLIGIKERISALGGEVLITTNEGKGTVLMVSIPMNEGGVQRAKNSRHTDRPATTMNKDLFPLPTKRPGAARRRKSSVFQG